ASAKRPRGREWSSTRPGRPLLAPGSRRRRWLAQRRGCSCAAKCLHEAAVCLVLITTCAEGDAIPGVNPQPSCISTVMRKLTRRDFLGRAAALGATLAWARPAFPAVAKWRERRDLFPEGVASGDPEPDSVILWTRRPFTSTEQAMLTAEVALDSEFRKVVARARAPVLAESDWTCRVLAAGLKPASVYWYRFVDTQGNGSRIGRTITAPRPDDPRAVHFTFVSCQSVNEGKQHAWRRMLWEDRHAPADQRLNFVLHLGDFIYEVVEYPDEVAHRYDRTVYEVCRIPDGRKVGNFHVPTTLEGYRTVYRGHLADPDIQDARAWWPFVCIGDNHEFSWQGWQSTIKYGGKPEPAQPLRVAAN